MNQYSKNLLTLFIACAIISAIFLFPFERITSSSYEFVCDGQKGGAAYLACGKLDLNKVGFEELDAISGIGPKIASAILQERAVKDGFKSWAEVDDVVGIGKKRLEQLKDFLFIQ